MDKLTRFVLGVTLGAAGFAGCGGSPLDQRGQTMAAAAARTSAALESSVGSTSLLSAVDVTDGISASALDDATQVIDLVLGACVDAQTVPPPARGLDLQFHDGCSIPFTPIELSGDLRAEVVDGGDGATFDVRFRKLELFGLALDGDLTIVRRDRGGSYRFDRLSAGFGDYSVTLAGAATASRSWSGATTFDGTGSITTDGETIAFSAVGIERGLGDCYPSQGSLTVTLTTADSAPLVATIRFDGDSADSGKVHFDYDGRTVDYQLPSRLCK